MSKLDEFYSNIATKWKNNRGVGTICIPEPLSYYPIMVEILEKMYTKNPNLTTLIVANDFNKRNEVVHNLKLSNILSPLIENKMILCLSLNYLGTSVSKRNMTILVGIEEHDFKLDLLKNKYDYILICKATQSLSGDSIFKLYAIAPPITNITNADIIQLNLTQTIVEKQYGCKLTETEDKQYNKCVNYISDTINIFGSFDNIELAKNGDSMLNISADRIRLKIAKENGWHENLDCSIGMDRQIDAIYNPNALFERATSIFNVIREKNKVVSESDDKLEKILNICLEHRGKQILIINKSAEFADKVTEYINQRLIKEPRKVKDCDGNIFMSSEPYYETFPLCASVHSKLKPCRAFDCKGNALVIKSGDSKGQPKMMSVLAQTKESMKLFNDKYINVLSLSAKPDKCLTVMVDVLIITSPLCDTIKEYKYRLDGMTFNSEPNLVYKLYAIGTNEEKVIQAEIPSAYHSIVNDCEMSDNILDNIILN